MKTVVITGSARGLGYEMAKVFRKNNVNVVLSDLNKDKLEIAKEELLKIKSKSDIGICVCAYAHFGAVSCCFFQFGRPSRSRLRNRRDARTGLECDAFPMEGKGAVAQELSA